MNGKTAKKLLMRSRHKYLFGPRAFPVLRFPLSILPPTPVWNPPGKHYFGGCWIKEEEDKTLAIYIRQVSGNYNPLLHEEKENITIHDLKKTFSWTDESGKEHVSWGWWEGLIEYWKKGSIGDEGIIANRKTDLIETKPLDPEIIKSYIEYQNWIKKNINLEVDENEFETLTPFQKAVWHTAHGWFTKTTYAHYDDKYAYLTFVVKWFYPSRKYAFSSALAKTVRIAKKFGINVRVIK